MSFTIIPAIDLIDGKCVRLTKGDYATKRIYHSDPVQVAKEFADHGITHLHLVDLDGAKARKIINYKVIEKISSATNLHIDFGGGLQSESDVKIAFESGANQITGGSIAVNNRSLFLHWLKIYGSDRVILGADAKDRKIAISGWLEGSEHLIVDFIASYLSEGIRRVISTDISVDGTLTGPSISLYKELIETFGEQLELVASGGVSQISDLIKLKAVGCYGVIVGKAIYENRISLKELEKFIIDDL